MRKLIYTLIFLLALSISVIGQSKKSSFKAYGKCGMCENRIEKAAKSIDGVTTAEWNIKTQIIDVTFDSSKTDVNKIQKAIAAVGHDTDMVKADNKIYEALPGCCKYDRVKEKKHMKKKMKKDVKKHMNKHIEKI